MMFISNSNVDTKNSNIFTNNSDVVIKNSNVVTKIRIGTVQLFVQFRIELHLLLVIMMNRLKQKYTTKSVKEKAKALDDLQNGLSNKEVAKKYNVPKNTLSTWVKNKEKILKAYEEGHAKRQRLKTAEFENIDAATYKWFLSKRCQNVPITGIMVQAKALYFAIKLNITNFQASDGWLRNWKER